MPEPLQMAAPVTPVLVDLPGYRRVAARLRQEIVDGVVPHGGWLRLQAVAERCETSIQPVREALQLLEGEGLVQIFPNRGARVRGVDRQRLIHIYEIREAVESMLTRRYCEEASLSDIRRLEEVQMRHDEATAARDVVATSATNATFHHLINSRAGNIEALEIASRYNDLGRTLHRRFGGALGAFERVHREHHMLLDAFRRRDTQAATQISAMHIRGTIKSLLEQIDALDPADVPAGMASRDEQPA